MTCICCSGPTKKRGSFQNKNRLVQRYQCLRCGKAFSEKQPLDGMRVDHNKVVQIVKLLCEGMGVRAAARLTGCQHKTVLAVLNAVGGQCAALHDRLVCNVQTGSLQIDELWARVGISQRRTTEADIERGDQYTYLAITAREKFIVSYHTGKRNYQNTDTFVADAAKRIVGRIQVTSDSFRPYTAIVRKHLLDRLDFATLQKIYAVPFDAKSEAWRRYSPPKCTGIKIKVRAGAPRQDRISTSYIERANLSVRHFTKRFVRLGLGWSRKLENHKYAVALFVMAHNFCKVHGTLGCTPAVGLKLATQTWTIEELIEEISS